MDVKFESNHEFIANRLQDLRYHILTHRKSYTYVFSTYVSSLRAFLTNRLNVLVRTGYQSNKTKTEIWFEPSFVLTRRNWGTRLVNGWAGNTVASESLHYAQGSIWLITTLTCTNTEQSMVIAIKTFMCRLCTERGMPIAINHALQNLT
jgi:hypothetical protein